MKRIYWAVGLVFIIVMVFWIFATHTNPKQSDEYYMEVALELAKHNIKAPFGALIVDNDTGEILAEGLNAAAENPTYHGEMVAINNALKKYPKINWKNVTLYTTAEPCSMCQSAVIWTGISRVVYGTSIQYLKMHGWNQIDISAAYVNSKAAFYKGTLTGGVLAGKTDVLFNKA